MVGVGGVGGVGIGVGAGTGVGVGLVSGLTSERWPCLSDLE